MSESEFLSLGSILVRTLAGEGFIRLKNGKILKCLPETLVALAPEFLSSYGCIQPKWSFWWIECENSSSLRFPANIAMNIRQVKDEVDVLAGSARMLPEGETAATEGAAAINLLLQKWYRLWQNDKKTARRPSDRLQDILALMQSSAEKPMSVATLARKACLSQGRFRQVFINSTGIPPKPYYDNLRLNKALSWLRNTDMKLANIASRLNYSSAFHFSRAFRKRFGRPPSEYRPK
jgi:AraC-like DNA-binding protein